MSNVMNEKENMSAMKIIELMKCLPEDMQAEITVLQQYNVFDRDVWDENAPWEYRDTCYLKDEELSFSGTLKEFWDYYKEFIQDQSSPDKDPFESQITDKTMVDFFMIDIDNNLVTATLCNYNESEDICDLHESDDLFCAPYMYEAELDNWAKRRAKELKTPF